MPRVCYTIIRKGKENPKHQKGKQNVRSRIHQQERQQAVHQNRGVADAPGNEEEERPGNPRTPRDLRGRKPS